MTLSPVAPQCKEDLEGAIADLTEAIRLDANNAPAHYARGVAEFTNAQRDRAAADIAEAARLDPHNPQFTAALKQIKP